MLQKFSSAARYTYNATVAEVNGGAKANKMQLRNRLVTEKENAYFEDKRWLLETPKVIRQQAVFEAAKNFKAAWSNKRAGNITKFKMGFKSKKKSNGCFVLGVEKQLRIKDGALHILPSFLGAMRHYEKLPFDDVPECDCSIRRDALGNYWLMVPIRTHVQARPYDSRPVVAMDPGVRNFLTCYATDGCGFTLGKDMMRRLMAILVRIDAIDSQLASCCNAKRRKQLRRQKLVLYQKYKNVRDDCHWKMCRHVAATYGTVLLPHLQTQALAGTLRTKTNREMQASSHWLFLQRLKEKCFEESCVFLSPQEHYTSKTCGCCGRLNNTLGSSAVFACPCGNVSHRDLHAARNILLKHLVPCELPPSMLTLLATDAHVLSPEGVHYEATTADSERLSHLM